MTAAFIFPGQGSQAVGMGKALAEAFPPAARCSRRSTTALGAEAVRADVRGPGGRPDPDRERPAGADGGEPGGVARAGGRSRPRSRHATRSFVAGHSLGEYSALAAAGAFTVADTARLLRIRGDAMQRAVPVGEGAMAALLGLEFDAGRGGRRGGRAGRGLRGGQRQWRRAGGGLRRQGGGRARHRDRQGKGAKRAMLLPVSAPFHCALMQPAAEAMAEALADVDDQARRACRWWPTCMRAADQRRRRDPQRAGRAGHRHGALARVRGLHGGEPA